MRGVTLIASMVVAGALGSGGCAAVFRDSKPALHVVSDPPGAEVKIKDKNASAPADINVPRSGVTEVEVKMPGFEDHHGTVRKKMNGLWLTADLATCILPVLLCVPLLVDAISGAWWDVEPVYRAHLEPLRLVDASAYVPDTVARPGAKPAASTSAAPAPPPTASSSMSDSERKASARAAYQEGIELQAKPSYPEALARFQAAQRIYDAPTHLLHIAQCLAHVGKLVEAQENYETLTHRELQGNAPEPFRDAVEVGRRELAELRPRIPTLRIEVKPNPATLRNLVIQLNGSPMSNEVIGIARPLNPGRYRITATAWGIPPAKMVYVDLEESNAKNIEIKLGH
jgi:PEGA domain